MYIYIYIIHMNIYIYIHTHIYIIHFLRFLTTFFRKKGPFEHPIFSPKGRESEMARLKRSIADVRAKWAQQKNLYEVNREPSGKMKDPPVLQMDVEPKIGVPSWKLT